MAKLGPCFTDPKLRGLFTKKELYDIMGARDSKMFIANQIQFLKDNKRRKYLQVLAQKRNFAEMPSATGQISDWVGGIIGQSRGDSWRVGLENNSFALLAEMHRDLAQLIEISSPKKFGAMAQKDIHDDIVRAIKGEPASPEAQAAAKAWTEADKKYMEMFNEAGGHVNLRSDWDIGTFHDPARVNSVPMEEWRDFTADLLDFGKMHTTRDRFLGFAPTAHDRIRTDGAIDIEPGNNVPAGMRGAMSNRHSQQRFYVFKDADSWLKYQRKFGNPNIFGNMMEHMHVLSKEITAMQTFGPNPELGFKAVVDEAIKRTKNKNIGRKANHQWQLHMGHTSPENQGWAAVGATTRNWMTGIHLPGAVISAVTDPGYSITMSRMRGIPVLKHFEFGLKSMMKNVTNRAEINKIAAELHLGMESLQDAAHSAARYSEITGSGMSARVADVMLRIGGLSPWTVGWKRGQGMAMSFEIEKGNFNNKRFAGLMERYGITQADMDIVANAPRFKRMGADFVDWSQVPRETAMKYVGMIRGQTRLAVPEPDVTTRAAMIRSTKAGSLAGEALRMTGQFKSHPFHVVLGNLNEIARGTTGKQRMEAMAELMVLSTVLGVIGQQAYEVSRGREPMEWDSPDLWGKGFMRGGGLGIISDVFLQDHERYGNIFQYAAGPAANDLYKHIWMGMLYPLRDLNKMGYEKVGDKIWANLGKSTTDLNPLSKIPYTRAVWDHYVNEAILKFTDPKAGRKLRKKERKRVKEFGNKSFMK